MVKFGQLVIGPPGSGKTTYCKGMQEFMRSVGRQCAVVNLDFANDALPYECLIDVRDLIALENVMNDMQLGPNGSLVYCMEHLLLHADWLEKQLDEKLNNEGSETNYIIFDCPGQVELYTHHHSMEGLVRHLEKKMDFRLCSVYLVDSFYCIEPATFISAAMIVAATMLRIALPHINVLSKIDMLPKFGKLPFALDFYTDARELIHLAEYVNYSLEDVQAALADTDDEDEYKDKNESEDKSTGSDIDGGDGDTISDYDSDAGAGGGRGAVQSSGLNLKTFSENLCSALDDLGLVSFLPLSIEDPDTVVRVLMAIDKANGYSLVYQMASQIVEGRSKQSSASKGKHSDFASSSGANLWSQITNQMDNVFDNNYDIIERYTAPSRSSSSINTNSNSNSNNSKGNVGSESNTKTFSK